ncbi:hypothetical protein KKA39_02480 [Patescibacteria group bacterium]|nr:hypothetical protein [Patescibacteria group bacterium]
MIASVNAQTTNIDSVVVTNNSAIVYLSFTGNSQDMYVRVNYGPGANTNEYWTPGYYIAAGTDTISIPLTGLNPSTQYSCMGFIYYPSIASSSVVTFTTDACSLPVSISVDSINACSEELTATTGFASYQWKRNGATINGATSNVYLAGNDGSYTVVVSDGVTCTATSSSVVVDVDEIPISTCADQEICEGESVTLTANGPTGSSYVWSDGSIGSSNSVNPTTTTTYTVTVTSGNCSSFEQILVEVNTLPNVTITATPDEICVNSVTGISFLVSPAGGTLSPANFNPATAGVGIHTVTYTYANDAGCESSASVDVEVQEPPTVSGVDFNGENLILDGDFPYPVQISIGGKTYFPIVQSATQVIFSNVDLEIGDLMIIQGIEGGCFYTMVFSSIEELSLYGSDLQRDKDNRIFDITGRQISVSSLEQLTPGIYIQGGKKFCVMRQQ